MPLIAKKNNFYIAEKSSIPSLYNILEIDTQFGISSIIARGLTDKNAQEIVKVLSFSAGTVGKELPKP